MAAALLLHALVLGGRPAPPAPARLPRRRSSSCRCRSSRPRPSACAAPRRRAGPSRPRRSRSRNPLRSQRRSPLQSRSPSRPRRSRSAPVAPRSRKKAGQEAGAGEEARPRGVLAEAGSEGDAEADSEADPGPSRPPALRTSPPAPPPGRPATSSAGAAARQGNPLGTTAFGSEIAGVDNPDFTYGYYLDRLLSLIDAPVAAPEHGRAASRPSSHFRIERDGTIADLRVAESSGYNSFDLAAMRAVQNAAPFPPLPRAYRHDSLGVNLIVR